MKNEDSSAQTTADGMLSVLAGIGVPHETIREITKSGTPKELVKLLRREKEELVGEIRFLREARSVIAVYLDFMTEGLFADESEIFVREAAERRIILGESNEYRDGEDFHDALARFRAARHTPEPDPAYPIGGRFDNMEDFLNAPSRPARFFSYDPTGIETMAGGLYLTGYARGPYGSAGDLSRRMADYAKRKGLMFTGPVYGVYLLDEFSVADPEQYLLRVSASVSEARRDPVRHIRRRGGLKMP
jgi:hypothetical protein